MSDDGIVRSGEAKTTKSCRIAISQDRLVAIVREACPDMPEGAMIRAVGSDPDEDLVNPFNPEAYVYSPMKMKVVDGLELTWVEETVEVL